MRSLINSRFSDVYKKINERPDFFPVVEKSEEFSIEIRYETSHYPVQQVMACSKYHIRFQKSDGTNEKTKKCLFAQKMFADIDNIPRAHGDQKVAFGAVLEKIVFNFVKGREILTGGSQFLNLPAKVF